MIITPLTLKMPNQVLYDQQISHYLLMHSACTNVVVYKWKSKNAESKMVLINVYVIIINHGSINTLWEKISSNISNNESNKNQFHNSKAIGRAIDKWICLTCFYVT